MKRNYVLPRIEILEVKIEKGFAATGQGMMHIDNKISPWEESTLEYSGNAVEDPTGQWGTIDWNE